MKKRVLLTGASGLFGANALFTGASRFDFFGTYFQHPVSIPGVAVHCIDLREKENVAILLKEIKPDVIIHTAAESNIDRCEKDHTWALQNNVAVTEQLATLATETKALFVYFSTDAFFEGTGRLFSEEDKPNPVNYYGETKKMAEEIIRQISSRHIIVRTNFFGWNAQNKLSLAEWILSSLVKRNVTPLFKDVIFSPLLVNTLAEITLDLIATDFTGTINVAGSEPVSKLEFGQKLCGLFKLAPDVIESVSVKSSALAAPRSSSMALSVEKLKGLFPKRNLGLDRGFSEFKRLLDSGFVNRLKQAVGEDLGFLTLLQ